MCICFFYFATSGKQMQTHRQTSECGCVYRFFFCLIKSGAVWSQRMLCWLNLENLYTLDYPDYI